VVGNPHHKSPLFTVETGHVAEGALDVGREVDIDIFKELVVEFARAGRPQGDRQGPAGALDFEWEFQMNR